ncbi:hypothetical protein [Bacillus oleivorans]|nr:hypothetical protein [Bacillus oleivorans]
MGFPLGNSRINEGDLNQIWNTNDLSVRESGNSDVDVNVNVNVDTRPIAYAILLAMYGNGQLSSGELNTAIRKLDELIHRAERRNRQQSSSPWLNY